MHTLVLVSILDEDSRSLNFDEYAALRESGDRFNPR